MRRRARERLGISSPMLEARLSAVPLTRYVALFEELAIYHRDPLLGAHLGMSQTAADALGPLGFLLLAMPTMGQGLEAVARYISTWQTGTTVVLNHSRDEAFWSYRIDDSKIWPRQQDSEYTLAVMCSAMRSRLNPGWRPLEVHFEHEKPASASALRSLFQAPIRFSQPVNQFVLDPTELDLPYQTPFACFIPYVEEYLRALIPQHTVAPDIVSQVHNAVRGAMSHREISLDWVSQTLQISPRTLQRQLATNGTNLRKIIQEVRENEAAALLQTGQRRRTDIAHALGYSDHTALWRASRSWSNRSPKTNSKSSTELKKC
ncbi:AraC family transcriptional regulator [Acidocella aminolytica 101 = DSM 11237]|nr:AraC family transcriptional regulator [Acidocella aminolytica 101 = DSM 11237]